MSIQRFAANDGTGRGWIEHDDVTGLSWRVDDDGTAVAVWDEAANGGTGGWNVDAVADAIERELFGATLADTQNYVADTPSYEPEPEAVDDYARRAALVLDQLEHEQAGIGRQLTNDERVPILRRVREQLQAGYEPDVHEARLAAEGDGELRLLDPSGSRQDSIDFQVARLADEEALARGDELGETPPPRFDGYDRDAREDRVAMMTDLVEGRVDIETARQMSGDGYRPSDLEEE